MNQRKGELQSSELCVVRSQLSYFWLIINYVNLPFVLIIILIMISKRITAPVSIRSSSFLNVIWLKSVQSQARAAVQTSVCKHEFYLWDQLAVSRRGLNHMLISPMKVSSMSWLRF